MLNSCFWKNRHLERVGRGGQDVEGELLAWGAGAGEVGGGGPAPLGGLFWSRVGTQQPGPRPRAEGRGCLKTRADGDLCWLTLEDYVFSYHPRLSHLERGW